MLNRRLPLLYTILANPGSKCAQSSTLSLILYVVVHRTALDSLDLIPAPCRKSSWEATWRRGRINGTLRYKRLATRRCSRDDKAPNPVMPVCPQIYLLRGRVVTIDGKAECKSWTSCSRGLLSWMHQYKQADEYHVKPLP
eukprot:scpid2915/ scgid13613/ 